MPVRASSDAQRKAVKKHDTEKVDRVTARLPKGTRDRILSTGHSVNEFVILAVLEKLNKEAETT